MKKIFVSISLALLCVTSMSVYAAPSCTQFLYPMNIGSRDSTTAGEVTKLQQFLIASSYLNVEATGYYGVLTTKAVQMFQQAYQLPVVGQVGPMTRAKIQALTCVVSGTTPTRSSSSLRVTYPNGGEGLTVTSRGVEDFKVRWTSTGLDRALVQVSLVASDGSECQLGSKTVTYGEFPVSSAVYDCLNTSDTLHTGYYKAKVSVLPYSSTSVYDLSDTYFSLTNLVQ